MFKGANMQLFDTEMMKREKGFVCNGCVHFVQLVLEKVSCTSRIVVLFFIFFLSEYVFVQGS